MSERTNRPDASVILLADILLAILLFAVCASVSFLIFAKADEIAASSRTETYAVNESDSLSELLHASSSEDGFLQLVKIYYPSAVIDADTITITYDDDFQADAEDDAYTMTVSLTEENSLLKADITVREDDDEIYQESASAVLSEAAQ